MHLKENDLKLLGLYELWAFEFLIAGMFWAFLGGCEGVHICPAWGRYMHVFSAACMLCIVFGWCVCILRKDFESHTKISYPARREACAVHAFICIALYLGYFFVGQ